MHIIDGVEGYCPSSFLSAVRPTVSKFLNEHRQKKFKMVLRCIILKTNLTTGESDLADPHLSSKIEVNIEGTDVKQLYDRVSERILENLASFQGKGSGWVR